MLNTCNFHLRFRLFFSLILSENAPNVDFREAKFQNFPGEYAPGPRNCTRAFGAPAYFCRTNSELLPPGLYVDEFHAHLNSIDPHIQFAYEVEQDGSISFLDTKTTKQPDGSIIVSVYRKPTNTDRYLDFNTHHHIKHKCAAAKTLLNRAIHKRRKDL